MEKKKRNSWQKTNQNKRNKWTGLKHVYINLSYICDPPKGIKWKPDEHGVIAFDCRNRKWYIQAATSPKDVVILVDVSGSMKGLRLTIARQTVSSILDTLGDDDFFNIIAVR